MVLGSKPTFYILRPARMLSSTLDGSIKVTIGEANMAVVFAVRRLDNSAVTITASGAFYGGIGRVVPTRPPCPA